MTPLALFSAAVAAASFAAAVALIRRRQGVDTAWPGLGDFVVAALLCVHLGLTSWRAFARASSPLTLSVLEFAILFYSALVGALVIFLAIRGLPPGRCLGLAPFRPIHSLLAALPYFLIGTAATLGASLAVMALHSGPPIPQGMLRFYADALRAGDDHAIRTTVLLAAVVAPITEEILFRGYLYPVLKQSAGPSAALLVSCALFAALHGHPVSLAPLFLLGATFTVAYERTASLLPCIFAHSLFNLVSLGLAALAADKPHG